jgi:putative ATPase
MRRWRQLLVKAEALMGAGSSWTPTPAQAWCAMADGDGRYLLTLTEEPDPAIEAQTSRSIRPNWASSVQKRRPAYDKNREGHYNLVSALHKSVRGSDPDAALYWLARMLEGGEDPLFIARRLVRDGVGGHRRCRSAQPCC